MAGGADGETRSDLSGSAGDVVQARDIRGGIHFHNPERAQPPVPAQLPGDVRGFVNRTADLDHLEAVLGRDIEDRGSVSVCVIAGTPGVGKTSLAVHWAHRNRRRFPDGQLYVNLRGYDPGELVAPGQALVRFLAALGIAPRAVPADIDDCAAMFRSLLADRRTLLVLDNAATVGQVRPLLPGAGHCLALVTSRSRLSGLITRDGAHRMTLDVFDKPAAVELLRATAAGYRDGDNEAEFAELARLCARLPLALRVAAERAAARPRMPMSDLIEDLQDVSRLWEALSSEGDEADAVRSVFAWSYRVLPATIARLFRLLGLHQGPDFSTGAAAAVADMPLAETHRLLDVLVGAHLVEQTDRDRYQFHDLLRAYAFDQAVSEEDEGGRFEAVSRLCAWYLSAASAATAALADPDIEGWTLEHWGIPVLIEQPGRFCIPDFTTHEKALLWLDSEADNALAVSRTAARAGLDGIAWKLPAVLANPYADRHPIRSWIPVGESALAAARRADDKLGQVAVLLRLGSGYRLSQQVQKAIDANSEALALAREFGSEQQVVAASLFLLGAAQVRGRRLDEAWDSFQQALSAAEGAGSALWTAWARNGLASVLFERGELAAAAEAISDARGDPSPNAMARAECLWIEAMILREFGQVDPARTNIAAAIETARADHITVSEAAFAIERGKVLLAAGEPQEALAVLQKSIVMHQHLGDRS